MNLLPQQRRCFDERNHGCVFLIVKLTHGCLKERNHPVHPCARSHRTQLRYRQRLFKMTVHFQCLPVHPTSVAIVVDHVTCR